MFNKKNFVKTAICTTALVVSTYSATSTAASLTGEATAVVVNPLLFVKNTDMDFGTISGGAGTVTIDPDTSTNTGSLVTSGVTPANFSVTANALTPYTIQYTQDAHLGNGVTFLTMPFATMTTEAVPGLLTGTGAAQAFNVGGTLTLIGTETNGSYTTLDGIGGQPFTVVVNY